MTLTHNRVLVEGDISPELEWAARDSASVAWDIETSGLDWSSDVIATCQLHVPDKWTEIVRIRGGRPSRLRELLQSERVMKVFHHAAFDLRFMQHRWNVIPHNVVCTKVLSKIVQPQLSPADHSLKPNLWRHLQVALDKSQQVSDWLSADLSPDQLAYAGRDVEFLLPLYERLMDLARADGLADIAERSFEYLPTRVQTDLRGCGDIFAY